MPLTKLDPATALIVIDLQEGIVSRETAHPVAPIVQRAARLADAFRRRHLPVVLVTVSGGAPGRTEQPRHGGAPPVGWDRLVSELAAHPSDHTLVKQCWGAFTKSPLDELLRQLGVTQVVIAGISTSVGVESTARQAYEHGYNVALVTDAMTDTDIVNHEHSVTRIFPRLGERRTTDEIVVMLEGET